MFRKKKDKETQVATASSSKSSTNTIGTVSQTTTRYSSVVTSIREIESSVIKTSINSSGSPIYTSKLSTNLLSNNLLSKSYAAHEIDAKPFNTSTALTRSSLSNGIGYQSPFSRKLQPLSSPSTDARPFNSTTESNKPSINIQTAFPRSQSTYSSYRPQATNTTNSLLQSSSTQSLPCSNEVSPKRDPRIPTYDTNGKKRGKVLVINNIKFLKELADRRGAEMDEKEISKLFKSMGFEVDACRDLKQGAMLDRLKKFKNDSSLKKVDMSILIMMSHGNNVDDTGRIIRGGFTQIYGTDDKGLQIDDVLNLFSAESCPALAGKPKIFIFQCCRGENSETLHNDAAPMGNVVKKHADMLIAFSTLPGFYSIRDTQQGSWYIQCICDVFKKHAKEFDVETLLKIVDQELSKKHPRYQQTSTYESRGFKCCYLNPK